MKPIHLEEAAKTQQRKKKIGPAPSFYYFILFHCMYFIAGFSSGPSVVQSAMPCHALW